MTQLGHQEHTDAEVELISSRARSNCLRLGFGAGAVGAHFGPALSLIEVLAAALGTGFNAVPGDGDDPERDRLILSKGHGSLALYTVLHEYGFISKEQIRSFECDGGELPGQPIRNHALGIEFSSGSLGMGLSFGVGLSLSARMTNSRRRVLVVMGDGETNEGSVWEAAMSAAHFQLNALTAIIDVNDMQSDGRTQDVLSYNHAGIWAGFGWDVIDVPDGHSIPQLRAALKRAPSSLQPRVLLAHTVKGKGVSFMEGNLDWHHGVLTGAQLEAALAELASTQGGARLDAPQR
jgi:transketolase